MNSYMSKQTVTMYTCQTKAVLDTVERDGVSYVKQMYVDQKYQETAWSFREAYGFFISRAIKLLEKPVSAQSPVWLFHDSRWAKPDQNSSLLKLRVPLEELLLFDLRKWNRILNLDLIGTEEEERRFEEELHRWGIMHSSDLFRNSFYPMQKGRVKDSWNLLFEDMQDIVRELKEGKYERFGNQDMDYIQGAAWCIKKEWIRLYI